MAELRRGQPPARLNLKISSMGTDESEAAAAETTRGGTSDIGSEKGRRAGTEWPTTASHQHVQVKRSVPAVATRRKEAPKQKWDFDIREKRWTLKKERETDLLVVLGGVTLIVRAVVSRR